MSNVACFARRGALAVGVLAVAAVTTPAQSLSYVGGLQYGTELERHRDAIARFGQGMRPIEALAKVLS